MPELADPEASPVPVEFSNLPAYRSNPEARLSAVQRGLEGSPWRVSDISNRTDPANPRVDRDYGLGSPRGPGRPSKRRATRASASPSTWNSTRSKPSPSSCSSDAARRSTSAETIVGRASLTTAACCRLAGQPQVYRGLTGARRSGGTPTLPRDSAIGYTWRIQASSAVGQRETRCPCSVTFPEQRSPQF